MRIPLVGAVIYLTSKPHLETEADIQLEIQTSAEFTSEELNFKKNFSIQSIVNSTDDGFASKIEQITSMATEEVCSDVDLILHNRYMVKFLGGGNYSHTVFEPHEMPIARQISAEINEQFQYHTVRYGRFGWVEIHAGTEGKHVR